MTASIVFIDSRVTNYQTLIDSLTEPAQVFVLDGAAPDAATLAAGVKALDAQPDIDHGQGEPGAGWAGGVGDDRVGVSGIVRGVQANVSNMYVYNYTDLYILSWP